MDLQMSHTTIYVIDQKSAYNFYVNKLGFEVKTDVSLGPNMRWLTASPKGQSIEIILMPVVEGMLFDKQSAKVMSELIKKGTLGFGVIKCKDVYATYEELKAKGVELKKEPSNSAFRVEAVVIGDLSKCGSFAQEMV